MSRRMAPSRTSGSSESWKPAAGGTEGGWTRRPGVQVPSPEGKYLGLIPTPRSVISAAFSGPDKKTLYVVGAGALGSDGKEFQTPQGVRNNAKTIYKIAMLAEGFQGRVK